MNIQAVKVELSDIAPLRALYLQETNFQIRYNSCHERGWTDSYLLSIEETPVGYASVKGQEIVGRDTIFEFYVVPPYRNVAEILFAELVLASGVTYMDCQSNDLFLASMLYQFTENIASKTILFEHHKSVHYDIPNAVFRLRNDDDTFFEHHVEPVGDYVLEINNEIVATGGFMLHYNKPFADLYMEVGEEWRQQGYGTFLVQQLITACFLAGRVPAARCDISNKASKATLVRAGMRICGFILLGEISYSRLSS